MAAPIGPGDWVECIDNRGDNSVSVGAIYLVEEIGESWGYAILVLKGVASPKSGTRWVYAECFRPIYRPREHAFDHLLTNLPVNTPEPA